MKAAADEALEKADKAQRNADESLGALRIVDIDRKLQREWKDELVARSAKLELALWIVGGAAVFFGGLASADAAGIVELDF